MRQRVVRAVGEVRTEVVRRTRHGRRRKRQQRKRFRKHISHGLDYLPLQVFPRHSTTPSPAASRANSANSVLHQPATAASWLPIADSIPRSRRILIAPTGSGPYPTTSPAQTTFSAPQRSASASTLSSAAGFACMSDIIPFSLSWGCLPAHLTTPSVISSLHFFIAEKPRLRGYGWRGCAIAGRSCGDVAPSPNTTQRRHENETD